MAVLTMRAASKQYLYARGIQAFDAASPDHATDPRTLPVRFAIVARGTEPQPSDWKNGEWVDTATARILVGTGGTIQPTAGRYAILLGVTGAVEQPENQIDLLEVT